MVNQPGFRTPKDFKAGDMLSASEVQALADSMVTRITGGRGMKVRTFGNQIIIERKDG